MPKINNVEDLNKLLEKYFDFLLTDYGFKRTDYTLSMDEINLLYPDEADSVYKRRPTYYITYHKAEVKIKISLWINSDCGPDIHYCSSALLYGSVRLGFLEEKNVVLKRLETRKNIWMFRGWPGYHSKTTVEELVSGLGMNYDKYTKYETEWMLKELAAIIFRHPEILHGDITAFPDWAKRP